MSLETSSQKAVKEKLHAVCALLCQYMFWPGSSFPSHVRGRRIKLASNKLWGVWQKSYFAACPPFKKCIFIGHAAHLSLALRLVPETRWKQRFAARLEDSNPGPLPSWQSKFTIVPPSRVFFVSNSGKSIYKRKERDFSCYFPWTNVLFSQIVFLVRFMSNFRLYFVPFSVQKCSLFLAFYSVLFF